MEKVATDIYTFSRLREDGFTYVDKTEALKYSLGFPNFEVQNSFVTKLVEEM